MYFADQLESDDDRDFCGNVLANFAALVHDSVDMLLKGWKIAEQAGWKEQQHHHATVQMMTRHVCESLDGVSVLAAQGCAETAKPLMRSSFEAMLGIQYILETDSERRGIAYQVAHAHRRISFYRKLDPNEQAGKELRTTLADDPLFDIATPPDGEMQKRIANWQHMFARSEFAPIEAEWQSKRKQRKTDPAWYSLFNGPTNIRELAMHLKRGAMYEFLYRDWSNSIHAADCFANISRGSGEASSIRPLRHPEGLQPLVANAVGMCISINRLLLQRYATSEQIRAAQADYAARIQRRVQDLHKREMINAPWR